MCSPRLVAPAILVIVIGNESRVLGFQSSLPIDSETGQRFVRRDQPRVGENIRRVVRRDLQPHVFETSVHVPALKSFTSRCGLIGTMLQVVSNGHPASSIWPKTLPRLNRRRTSALNRSRSQPLWHKNFVAGRRRGYSDAVVRTAIRSHHGRYPRREWRASASPAVSETDV